MHTCYSHGRNTPFEMHAAANAAGLEIIGFSEHSPRPLGYDYSNEYRERLNASLELYFRQVRELARLDSGCRTLLAMEMDWLCGEEAFIERNCRCQDFDYLIGSVHFLGRWGFDDLRDKWDQASQEQCEAWYEQYFRIWRQMLSSGLFNIAAHPDLIKIFSVNRFQVWLDKAQSMELVRDCLLALRDAGMAMEVSSAGLRKPCAEIYPCPAIMTMARSMDIPISMASDAHCVADVGGDFERLESYARSFGYDGYVVFQQGKKSTFKF